jgi:hypothetical protein
METQREFAPADRYRYDFKYCTVKNGFAQIDTSQDASYFGTWASPERLVIFNYCEGDCTTQTAVTPEEFTEAIRELKTWNEEYGHEFLGIDCGLSTTLEKQFQDIGLGDLLH